MESESPLIHIDLSPNSTAAEFAKNHWSNPSALLRTLKDDPRFQVTKKQVRTIAIFFHAFGIGGGERVTRDLALLWNKIGYKVIVITNVEPREGDFSLPSTIERFVIPTYVGITNETYAERSQALQSILIEANVDVVVFAHWFSDALAFDMLSVKSLGIPFFLFIQSSFTQFFLDADLPSWYVDIPLQYQFADGIICLSEMDKLFWSKFNSNVVVTQNPITQPIPDKPSAPLAGHNVIWPARVHADKYPLRVVPIMRALIKKVPDAKIWMVGPADQALEQQLIELANSYGSEVAASIVLCGPQDEEQMQKWYEQADTFLLTSKREGWSLALAEALATGLPCVMYDLPYLPLVQNNPAVISVPQGNAEAAADALAVVLLQKETAQEMGRKGNAFMRDMAAYGYESFWKECFSSVIEQQAGCRHNALPLSFTEKVMWSELLAAYRSHLESFEEERQIKDAQQHASNREIQRLTERVSQLEREPENIRNSKSYRIGVAITAIPRAIKRFLIKQKGAQ